MIWLRIDNAVDLKVKIRFETPRSLREQAPSEAWRASASLRILASPRALAKAEKLTAKKRIAYALNASWGRRGGQLTTNAKLIKRPKQIQQSTALIIAIS